MLTAARIIFWLTLTSLFLATALIYGCVGTIEPDPYEERLLSAVESALNTACEPLDDGTMFDFVCANWYIQVVGTTALVYNSHNIGISARWGIVRCETDPHTECAVIRGSWPQ